MKSGHSPPHVLTSHLSPYKRTESKGQYPLGPRTIGRRESVRGGEGGGGGAKWAVYSLIR